jgi:hypothetical protein
MNTLNHLYVARYVGWLASWSTTLFVYFKPDERGKGHLQKTIKRECVERVANTNPITNRRRQPFATLCIYRGPRATCNRQTSHSLSAHGLSIDKMFVRL